MQLFWICVGGAAGTAGRYLLTLWAADRLGASFPYGTLAVNLIGCFLIAIVVQLAAAGEWPVTLRLALTTGVLGGFTTYSAFNHDTLRLFSEGQGGLALTYVAATLVGGLLCGGLGLAVARLLIHR
jgi:CrcB protein